MTCGGRPLAFALLAGLAACAPALPGTSAAGRLPAAALPVTPPATEPAPIPPGFVPTASVHAPGWDVLDYAVEIALPEGPGWIAARAVVTAIRTAAGATPLPLDLVGLSVQDVAVDGHRVAAAHEAGKLRVPVPSGPKGDTVRVAVVYAGVPDDGLVLGATVHGHPSAFADNWPDRARFWFPAVDHPSDKATAGFTVHAPAGWRVIGNGDGGEPSPTPAAVGGPAGPRLTWRWRTDVPIPTYTMVIGGADMEVDTVGTAACGRAPASARADGCVAVTTWLFPDSRKDGGASFARAARMVDLYADWIGPFPYEKLAHVQSSTRFGGMENASAIFYSERAIAAGRDLEGTVAHETAHQWFGDSVTEADWRHLWLSEGFATYFGALFFEWEDGEAAFRARLEDDRRAYLGSDATSRPLVDPRADDLFALLNENSYQKGAWVLHMLRGLIGDEAFRRGIRAYYAAHRDGTALSADLRAALERASGRDLGWFFTQWLDRPGHPVFRTTHAWDAGAGEIVVTVEQVQPADWPRFRVPTELLVRGAWGERRAPVELDGARTVARVTAPGPAADVVVDPDGWVLKGDPQTARGGA